MAEAEEREPDPNGWVPNDDEGLVLVESSAAPSDDGVRVELVLTPNSVHETKRRPQKRLARYAEVHKEYRDHLEQFCRDKQVAHFAADTETPFDEMVLRVLRRGGLLR